MKGSVKISQFGEALLLFDFKVVSNAKKVFLRGVRRFKDRVLSLDWWSPMVGCYQKEVHAKEVWVKVVGLPLHLWCRETSKKNGDSCEGFVQVDEDTASGQQMQWARVLVRSIGSATLGTLQIVEGLVVYAVHLWWEVPPWLSRVESKGETSRWKERDEGEG